MKSRKLLAGVLVLSVASPVFSATDGEIVRIVSEHPPLRVSAAVALMRSPTGARATIASGSIEAFHAHTLARATAAEVRLRREKLGLTQEQLEARGELKPDFVALVESTNKEPSLEDVFKLAKALRVSVQDLVGGIAAQEAMMLGQPAAYICAVSAFIGYFPKELPEAYFGWMPLTETADVPLALILSAGQPVSLPEGTTMNFAAHGVFAGHFGQTHWLGLRFRTMHDGKCQGSFYVHEVGRPW